MDHIQIAPQRAGKLNGRKPDSASQPLSRHECGGLAPTLGAAPLSGATVVDRDISHTDNDL